VDYKLRRKLLFELQSMKPAEILARMDDGLPKLHVTHTALKLRREHPEWFGAEAAYTPVLATGAKAEHVVGYLRGDRVMTLTPRFPLTLEGDWADTMIELPAGRWHNRLTGEDVHQAREQSSVAVSALLRDFPVALLVRELARDEEER
jgi:(1->4)-alpha-D-glucan 1-alpha-D-glucosylmutase